MESSIKQRKKVAILLTSEPNFNKFALKYFILNINQIQSTYEFVFPEIDTYFYTEATYDWDSLANIFQDKVRPSIKFEGEPDYFINIIRWKIDGNLFSICADNLAFITTDEWEKLFSPPSLFEYLLNCICATLVIVHPQVSLSYHPETRGCPFDYARYKMDAKVGISLGHICDGCKKTILNSAGPDYLNEISNIISRKWIGNINTFDSVAYNLERFFNFDIDKDSGFNKTYWERAREHLPEIPKQSLGYIISAIVGAGIALLFKLFLAS